MKNLLLASLAAFTLLFSACKKNDVGPKPADATGTPPPAGFAGKWLYGQFSPYEYWDDYGHYVGNGFEQAVLIELTDKGAFSMYILNSATSYSCRTTAYTTENGPAIFDVATQHMKLKPTKARYKGEYSCYPSKNFERAATASEVANLGWNFHYVMEEDNQGKPQLHLFFNDDDTTGSYFRRLED